MKRGISFLLTLFFLSFLLVGCSDSTKVDKISPESNSTKAGGTSPEPLIKEFISKLYTVDDYKTIDLDSLNTTFPNDKYTSELKKVAGEKALVSFVNDRTQLAYITACIYAHINIKITSTNVDKYSSDKDGSEIYNYSAKLQLAFPDEDKQVEEEVRGQLTLKMAGGKWTITLVNKTDVESIVQKYRKKY